MNDENHTVSGPCADVIVNQRSRDGVSSAAEATKVSERSLMVPRTFVYALARRGDLPTVRLGERYVRFRDESVWRWIEDSETAARTNATASG